MAPDDNLEGFEIVAQSGAVEEPVEVGEVVIEEPATSEDVSEAEESGLEAEPEDASSDDPADGPQKKSGFGKRIDELTRLRREAEEKAAEAERKAAYWEGRATGREPIEPEVGKEPVVPKTTTEKPQEGDFDDYADFVEALADWKTDKRIAELESRRTAETAEQKFEEWSQQGKAKYADFQEVALRQPHAGGPKISPAMAEAIKDSPMSHDLAYYLGKNKDESARIASLSPMAAAREIGKLEAGLSTPESAKPRTITKAPAPIKPITGDGSAAVANIEDLPIAEYIAYQNRKEFGAR